MNNFKYIAISLALAVVFSLQGCGGDEEPTPPTPADGKANAKEDTAKAPQEATPPEPEEEPEPEPVPDPNGVYLPNDEEYNGKPVYADGDGFYLWFNGLEWRISDKMGAGKSVA